VAVHVEGNAQQPADAEAGAKRATHLKAQGQPSRPVLVSLSPPYFLLARRLSHH
jgi:hypothetical protein